MNQEALKVIQKTQLIEKLWSGGQRESLLQTLTFFISSSNIDFEKSSLQSIHMELEKGEWKSAAEQLKLLRDRYINDILGFSCSKKWDALVPTSNDDVRFCHECNRNVFKVFNKDDYRKRKQLNQCVAINFGEYEKVNQGLGCELWMSNEFELIGDPVTIEE